MLGNYRLVRIHLGKYERTFHAHISNAYRKGNQENSRLICIGLYRTQRNKSWARTGAINILVALNMWVKSIIIYVDVVIYVDEYEIDMGVKSIVIYADMCW